MKKRIIFVLFLLFAVMPLFAQQQREVKWVNPEIREMEGLNHRVLKSNALACDVGYVVWTPEAYAQNPEKRFPVLYFLHGLGGTEASDAASFSEIVSTAIMNGLLPPVICVFPNGGVSWYQGDVEKMIIEELLPAIDANYRTIARAQSRVLTGFSMGGYGSVYLSVMHPELFCAAGSFGGRLRSNEQYLNAVENAIPVWKENNFGLFFVNGDNDRPDEFKNFATDLETKGIESVVVVLPETAHDLGKYYRESSGQLFKFINTRIKTETKDADYKGFYVKGTKIYDGNDHIFTPYGINTLFMYQDPGGAKTIPGISRTSANCIRMFWQDDKNVPLSVLDGAVGKAVDNQLVVIVGLWEATGKWQNIDQCINYWLRDDVKAMVQKYEQYFILNIANEAGDDTIPEAAWENKYIEAVKKLRNAGYRVPLMIDPANWGRGERYILNCGEKVLAADPLQNIIFSWHPWDINQPTHRYTNAIRTSLDKNLCMIVGEFSHLGANYEGILNWRPLVEECNKHGIGWLWWSWCLTNDKHNIVNSFDFDQQTEWGAQILSEMKQMAVKASIFNLK